MRKSQLKFGIFIFGVLGGLVVVGIIIWGFSQFIAAFQQGADPASIFHGNLLIIPTKDQAVWLPDATDTGALPSQSQREEILSGYWQAWNALGRAYATGDPSDLATYWAGGAFRQLYVDPKRHIDQVDSEHKLMLTYFAQDGTVVAFQDRDFLLTQTVNKSALKIHASANIIMTLDNGYWRIRLFTMHYQP